MRQHNEVRVSRSKRGNSFVDQPKWFSFHLQEPKKRRKSPPPETDHEKVWQRGLLECMQWKLDPLALESLLNGDDPPLMKIAKLVSHHGWLTYIVARDVRDELGLGLEEERDIWARAWEALYVVCQKYPHDPDWAIELALHNELWPELVARTGTNEPSPPELEVPLAALFTRNPREREVVTGRLNEKTERDIAREGLAKTTVHRTLETLQKRAKQYANN